MRREYSICSGFSLAEGPRLVGVTLDVGVRCGTERMGCTRPIIKWLAWRRRLKPWRREKFYLFCLFLNTLCFISNIPYNGEALLGFLHSPNCISVIGIVQTDAINGLEYISWSTVHNRNWILLPNISRNTTLQQLLNVNYFKIPPFKHFNFYITVRGNLLNYRCSKILAIRIVSH